MTWLSRIPLARRLFCALGLSCLPAPAMAASSGLNLIPTADVLPRGAISAELESTGGRLLPQDSSRLDMLLQVGITNRVEAGWDRPIRNPDGAASTFNAKWLVVPAGARTPAVAVGVQSLRSGQHSHPYIATTKSVGSTRLHGGALYDAGILRPLVGVDHPLGKAVFQADFTGGANSIGSVGLAVPIHRRATLTYAATLPTRAGSVGHVLNLAVQIGPQ